jgi:two-component system response regulator YesN
MIIEENFGMRLGLDTFAEKYRLTPEYISNLFAKETGMTFSNYLKRVRIEKAKELILQTDLKIYEVACSVGYPDQKYFSKVFKEYTGVSAKQFTLEQNSATGIGLE